MLVVYSDLPTYVFSTCGIPQVRNFFFFQNPNALILMYVTEYVFDLLNSHGH
jgi:hypothetical protein